MVDKAFFIVGAGLLTGGAMLFAYSPVGMLNTQGIGLILFGWGIIGTLRGLMK